MSRLPTKKKLLLIEDDPLMFRLYQKTFALAGFDILIATDGEMGLEKARTESPKVILLDIMMPKLNGYDVLSQLKADAVTKHIPVVILTNLTHKGEAKTAISMGASKYLVKSEVSPQEVLAVAQELLDE